MPGYKYSAAAEADLNNISDYTTQNWGVEQAFKYIDGLEDRVKSLAEHPAIGRPCNNLYKGLRAFPYGSHHLYYVEDKSGITIVRVLHERMNPAAHFGEEPR